MADMATKIYKIRNPQNLANLLWRLNKVQALVERPIREVPVKEGVDVTRSGEDCAMAIM